LEAAKSFFGNSIRPGLTDELWHQVESHPSFLGMNPRFSRSLIGIWTSLSEQLRDQICDQLVMHVDRVLPYGHNIGDRLYLQMRKSEASLSNRLWEESVICFSSTFRDTLERGAWYSIHRPITLNLHYEVISQIWDWEGFHEVSTRFQDNLNYD
jgi:hypothetical protein